MERANGAGIAVAALGTSKAEPALPPARMMPLS